MSDIPDKFKLGGFNITNPVKKWYGYPGFNCTVCNPSEYAFNNIQQKHYENFSRLLNRDNKEPFKVIYAVQFQGVNWGKPVINLTFICMAPNLIWYRYCGSNPQGAQNWFYVYKEGKPVQYKTSIVDDKLMMNFSDQKFTIDAYIPQDGGSIYTLLSL